MPAGRDGQVVDDVQQRDGDDVGAVEPVGHVDVLDLALGDGAEEQHRVGHPDHRDQDVDRPFQLGVFLALGDAQRQRDGGGHDDQLPAPEHERGQLVRDQPHVAGALHHVQAGGEQRAAAEREDHRVGVQRAQAAVAQPRDALEIQGRPVQLGGDDHADQHAHDAPDHGHHRELAHHLVVVCPKHRCEAIALGEARVCELPFASLSTVASQLPSLQRQLLRVMGQSADRDHDHVDVLSRRQASERIAMFLQGLGERFHRIGQPGDDFQLPMSRDEIARYLGLALETVSRGFTRLHDDGVIEVRGRRVRIVDAKGLQAIAHGCEPESTRGVGRQRPA
jgi:hypothetical protein